MSKGCIQVKIGNKTYQFNGIDIESSMPLNKIVDKLSLSDRTQVKEIIDLIKDKTDINDINKVELTEDRYTTIGDFAVGNANAGTLAGMFKFNMDPDADKIYSISKLLGYDNNILFTNSIESDAELYVGTKRDFLVINSTASLDKVLKALYFSYASRESRNTNSKIFRYLYDKVFELKNTNITYKEKLDNLDTISASRKLLYLLFQDNDDVLKTIRAELTQVINNSINEKVEEVNSELEAQEKQIEQGDRKKITVNKDYIQLNESINKLVSKSNSNYNIIIDEKPYTPQFVNEVINEMYNFKEYTSTTTTSSGETFPERLNGYIKAYYNSLNPEKDSSKIEFLNGILFSKQTKTEGIEVNDIASQIFKSTNNSKIGNINAILKFIFPAYEIVKGNVEDINNNLKLKVSNSLELGTPRITSNGNNSAFTFIKDDKKTINVIFVRDTSKNFITKTGTKPNNGIKVNLNVKFTDNDIKTLSNLLYGRSQLVFDSISMDTLSDSEKENIFEFFEKLNINGTKINKIHTSVGDDLSLSLVETIKNTTFPIKIVMYPRYYGQNAKLINRKFGSYYKNYDLSQQFDESQIERLKENKPLALELKSTKYIKYNKFIKVHSNSDTGDEISILNTTDNTPYRKKISRVIRFDYAPIYDPKLYELDNIPNSTIVNFVFNNNVYTGVVTNYNEDTKQYSISTNDAFGGNFAISKDSIKSIIGKAENKNGYYYSNIGLIKKDGKIVKDIESYYEYFEESLRDIYNNSGTSLNYEEFLKEKFPTVNSLLQTKYVILEDIDPPIKIEPVDITPSLLHPKGTIEVICDSMRRRGIPIHYGTSKDGIKAFTHNGEIYINRNECTIDSPLHELFHLLIAEYRFKSNNKYLDLLNSLEDTEEFKQTFKKLKNTYNDLTINDFKEEVLVHMLADYFSGRLMENYDKINQSGIDIVDLTKQVLQIENIHNIDLLQTTISKLILDNNSSLINNLLAGVHKDKYIEESKLARLRSKLLQNGKSKKKLVSKLEEKCQ